MTEVGRIPEDISAIVDWAQALVAGAVDPALSKGGLAVDLTAGNGADTEFLYGLVGEKGRVAAFDIQQQALDNTAGRLAGQGASVAQLDAAAFSAKAKALADTAFREALPAAVTAICADHANWREYVPFSPAIIMANLGYLPGGDKQLMTTTASIVKALEDGLECALAGSVVAVTCYIGHPGGPEEASAVEGLFAALKPAQWRVVRLSLPNRDKAPILLFAQKR